MSAGNRYLYFEKIIVQNSFIDLLFRKYIYEKIVFINNKYNVIKCCMLIIIDNI